MISKDREEAISVRKYFARRLKFSHLLRTIAKQGVPGLLVSLLSFCSHNVMCALSKMKVSDCFHVKPFDLPFALAVRKLRTNLIYFTVLPIQWFFSLLYTFFISIFTFILNCPMESAFSLSHINLFGKIGGINYNNHIDRLHGFIFPDINFIYYPWKSTSWIK